MIVCSRLVEQQAVGRKAAAGCRSPKGRTVNHEILLSLIRPYRMLCGAAGRGHLGNVEMRSDVRPLNLARALPANETLMPYPWLRRRVWCVPPERLTVQNY